MTHHLHRVPLLLLAAVALADTEMAVQSRVLVHKFNHSRQLLTNSLQYVVAPKHLYDPSGNEVKVLTNGGYVLRYSAYGCVFCRKDTTAWRSIAQTARSRGFEVVTLLPRNADQFPASDAERFAVQKQIAYADPKWFAQFRFTVTPSLIIVDKNGLLLWGHVGTLGLHDVQEAQDILRDTKGR